MPRKPFRPVDHLHLAEVIGLDGKALHRQGVQNFIGEEYALPFFTGWFIQPADPVQPLRRMPLQGLFLNLALVRAALEYPVLCRRSLALECR